MVSHAKTILLMNEYHSLAQYYPWGDRSPHMMGEVTCLPLQLATEGAVEDGEEQRV